MVEVIIPTQGGPLAEQAAQIGADEDARQQLRAHELHVQGADSQAATAQEWGAMAVGVGPVNPNTGKREPVRPAAYLIESSLDSGKSGFVQAHPKDVMDVLRDRALAEAAERTTAQAVAPVTKTSFLGRIGLSRKK